MCDGLHGDGLAAAHVEDLSAGLVILDAHNGRLDHVVDVDEIPALLAVLEDIDAVPVQDANIPAEFSKETFDRGIVGMARSQDPNSANSQFFIMFAPGPFLDGQYTVVGRVIEGMDVVDQIKRGAGGNGEVSGPDQMAKVTVE